MKLYCDKKAAMTLQITLINTTELNVTDRHFIKEKLNEGTICVAYVKSEEQLADVSTKGVSSRVFNFIVSKLGMKSIYMPT